MDFTSTGIIEQVIRKGSIPENQTLYSNADILNFVNEELQNKIIPYITAVKEDYFLYEKTYTADGTKEYLIPQNSIGNKVKSISVWNSDGKYVRQVPRIEYNTLFSTVDGYYIFNNKIIFYPRAIESNLIKIAYYKRPNVLTENYFKITGISHGVSNTTYTVNTDPTAIISANDYIDISSKNSPFNTVLNVQVSSVTSTTIVVPLNSEGQIGDYISLEGYSAFAQIPQEIVSLLVQATIVKIMESMGDYNGFQAAIATYQQMENDNRILLSQRTEFPVRKILGRNKLIRWIM